MPPSMTPHGSPFVEVLPDERKESAAAFFARTFASFAARGVAVEQVVTDNGSCYRWKLFAKALAARTIRHIFTRPPLSPQWPSSPPCTEKTSENPHLAPVVAAAVAFDCFWVYAATKY